MMFPEIVRYAIIFAGGVACKMAEAQIHTIRRQLEDLPGGYEASKDYVDSLDRILGAIGDHLQYVQRQHEE